MRHETSGVAAGARSPAVLVAFIAALALAVFAYAPSFFSIVAKWAGDAAFSHGFLILPVSAWLAWRERSKLAQVAFQPSIWGVAATLACALAWVVAKASGVLVVEQFAAVALIPALVLAAFGWPVVRVLWFPLLFLFFAVPFGRALVPPLMQVTADFATLLLQWSGVPVFRSHMLISIPSGNFEVARACSGLNYLVTAFVLGVLYAYLNFHGWRKRLICVAAFVVIPIVLNGLRVYITILVSHWTEMRFGPGYEHVTFGRIFFVVIIVALFWIGRRWHDLDEPAESPARGRAEAVPATANSLLTLWPLVLAVGVALAGPPLFAASVRNASAALADTAGLVRMPDSAATWQGPRAAGNAAWRPLYHGGLVEKQVAYQAADGASVDVFVAVYGLGRTHGAEMISSNNVLTTRDRKSLASEHDRRIGGDGTAFTVRELTLEDDDGAPRLVWYWFMVGERPVTGAFAAKALEAAMVVTGGAHSERIVVISTHADGNARARLEGFVRDHSACVTSGFQGEACGP